HNTYASGDESALNINVAHRVINEQGSVDNNPNSGVAAMIISRGGITYGQPVLHDTDNSGGVAIDVLAEGTAASTSNGRCDGVLGVSSVSQRGRDIPRPVSPLVFSRHSLDSEAIESLVRQGGYVGDYRIEGRPRFNSLVAHRLLNFRDVVATDMGGYVSHILDALAGIVDVSRILRSEEDTSA